MKRRPTMFLSFILAVVLPGALLLSLLATLLVFGTLYANTGADVFLIWLIVSSSVFVLLYVTLAIFEVRSLYQLYYKGLFAVSRENFARLGRGDPNLKLYPRAMVREFSELNQGVSLIRERWSRSYLFSDHAEEGAVELSYLRDDMPLVSAKELREHLGNLVHLSLAFTVGLMELYYDLGDTHLRPEEKENLLLRANSAFSFVSGRVIAENEDGSGIYVFLPGVDSNAIIQEKVYALLPELTVSRRGETGMAFQSIRASYVAYPYSDIEDMFTDLKYAKRQGKVIVFFLPERTVPRRSGSSLHDHSQDIAFYNRMLNPLYTLAGKNPEEERSIIEFAFSSFASFVGANKKDIIVYERNSSNYYSYLTGTLFPKSRIEALLRVKDVDNSLYFSHRESLVSTLARDIDEEGIISGFYFCLFDGKDCLGIYYLASTNTPILLDVYAKEALLRLGRALTFYFSSYEREARAVSFAAETEHLLSLSPYLMYKVHDGSLGLTYLSENMKTLFPKAEVGMPCFKALYGLDRMCPHCPMKTFAKMNGKVKGTSICTSLTMNDRKSHERTMLIEKVSSPGLDPYDRDLLCFSHSALFHSLEDAYEVSEHGYLLLLCLDNLDLFAEKQGSEGMLFVQRSFIAELKAMLHTQDVYSYAPGVLGLLLPRIGHADVIDMCERIYEMSKRHFYDDGTNEDKLSITYLPLGYPRGYASAGDFLSSVDAFYRGGGRERGKDFIYFRDHSISRSASRKEYMLAVIDEVFTEKTASCVTLQPMLTASDKKIYGAELLLRVEDKYRGKLFYADELSRLAQQNGKISLITESLLRFVGELYDEYGNNAFVINSFKRVAINVDASILSDRSLSESITKVITEHRLPKEFLSFEVPEDLILGHDEKESIAFSKFGASLAVDRYMGKFVSLPKIKALGFVEVKIAREMILGIEEDQKRYEAVKAIVTEAKSLGLKVSCVGVENAEQFALLRDLDPNMLVQGFLFYKPLSRSDLIAALGSRR